MRDSTIARAENRALLNRTYAICAITRENFDVIRSDLSSTAGSISVEMLDSGLND